MSVSLLYRGPEVAIYAWEPNKRCDARQFLEALRRSGNRDFERLQRIMVNTTLRGVEMDDAFCKPLWDGVFEFKCAGVSRIAWFFADSQQTVIICTIGYVKPPSNRAYRPVVDQVKVIKASFFDVMTEEEINALRP